jgi:hypothetical protein
MLHRDTAASAQRDDVFGFVPLADQLADRLSILISAPPTAGLGSFVVGIEGAWGSGKTTFVEFMKAALSASHTDVHVIHLDPWWYSNGSDLQGRILREIFSSLPIRSNSRLAKFAAELSNRVSALPDGIDAILGLSPKTKPLAEALEALRDASGDASAFFSRTIPARALRQKLADEMVKTGHKALVIIDDIDRLTPEDLRNTLDAIRTTADLPGITYILCYDSKNVDKLLQSAGISTGIQYLEKIVNASILMPIQSTYNLRRYLLSKIDQNAVLKVDTVEATEHLDAIVGLLDTPREAIRLANAFNFWSAGKLDEVYAPDALILEALRITCPGIVTAILRLAPVWFGSQSIAHFGLNDEQRSEQRRSDINAALAIDGHPRERLIRYALAILFPQFAKLIDSDRGYLVSQSSNPSHLRISDQRHFFTYFFHQPLPGMPPRSIVSAALHSSTVNDKTEALRKIADWPSGDVDPLEVGFGQIVDEIERAKPDVAQLRDLLLSLAQAGPAIAKNLGRRESDFIGQTYFFKRIIHGCVSGLEKPDETASALMRTITDPLIGGWVALYFSSGTDKYPFSESHERLTNASVPAVEGLIDSFISSFWSWWATGEIFTVTNVPHLFHMAERWGQEERISEEFMRKLETREGCLQLFNCYKGFGNIASSVALHARIDVDQLKAMVEKLFPEQVGTSSWPAVVFDLRF